MEKKNLLSLTILIFVTVISFIFWFTWRNNLEVSANLTIYLAGILILIPLITILDALFLLGRKGYVITALVLLMLPVFISDRFYRLCRNHLYFWPYRFIYNLSVVP